MKKHLLAASIAAFLSASNAHAGPGLDVDIDELGLLEVEAVDVDMVRSRDGTLVTNETFTQADGSSVKRMTVRKATLVAAHEPRNVDLTPAQRRLIWNAVAVQRAAQRGDEVPPEVAEQGPVREHIEAASGPKPAKVGARMAVPSALQPLPENVTIAIPSVQDYLFAVVDQRVLVVEPTTQKVVAEVVR